MQELNVAEVGTITIKKLSKRDYEILRNECVVIDPNTKTEKTESGSFIKYLVLLGVSKAPFFKSEYLENARLDNSTLRQREDEYYASDIPQNVFDKIMVEVRNHNKINDSEVKEVSKK